MEKVIALLLGIVALGVIIKFVYFPAVPEPMEYAAQNVKVDLKLKWERAESDKATVHLQLTGTLSNKGKRKLSVVKVLVPYKLTIQPGDKIIKKEITVDLGALGESKTKEVDQRISSEGVPERVNIGLWYHIDISSASY